MQATWKVSRSFGRDKSSADLVDSNEQGTAMLAIAEFLRIMKFE
jgi:hypothetical protein